MNDEHVHDPTAGDGTHERYRELLALALYDELDADETALLAGHLAHCAACRTEQSQLAGGLGANTHDAFCLGPAAHGDIDGDGLGSTNLGTNASRRGHCSNSRLQRRVHCVRVGLQLAGGEPYSQYNRYRGGNSVRRFH